MLTRYAPGSPVQFGATNCSVRFSMPQAKPVWAGSTRAMLITLWPYPYRPPLVLSRDVTSHPHKHSTLWYACGKFYVTPRDKKKEDTGKIMKNWPTGVFVFWAVGLDNISSASRVYIHTNYGKGGVEGFHHRGWGPLRWKFEGYPYSFSVNHSDWGSKMALLTVCKPQAKLFGSRCSDWGSKTPRLLNFYWTMNSFLDWGSLGLFWPIYSAKASFETGWGPVIQVEPQAFSSTNLMFPFYLHRRGLRTRIFHQGTTCGCGWIYSKTYTVT